jgi:membrane protease YdiL (CAAX protease family)
VVTLAIYNIVQNTVLPQTAYVPANLIVAAALTAQARRDGCTWEDLGLDLREWRRALPVGVLGVALIAGAMSAALRVPGMRAYLVDERARGHRRREVVFRSLVRFPFGTALFEEIAFRGVLYGVWKREGMTARRAALLTGFAFGLWHFLPGRTALAGNPLQMKVRNAPALAATVAIGAATTGVASLGLTWLRERSHSLLAPWLLHAGMNSIGYLSGVASWKRVSLEQ